MNQPLPYNECIFCHLIARGPGQTWHEDGPGAIYEGRDLAIVPDLAPLTPHHVLIMSREHFFAMKSLGPQTRPQLALLKKGLRRFHEQEHGLQTLFFEHGSCSGYSGAACIAHAHLHAVPLSQKQLATVLSQTLKLLGPPNQTPMEADYLYAEFIEDNELYWPDSLNKRQFFRILVADALANVDRAKWQNCISGSELLTSRSWLKACVKSWNRFSVVSGDFLSDKGLNPDAVIRKHLR